MKKCLILFGEYRGNRTAIEWDSKNRPDDWESFLITWNKTQQFKEHTDSFSDTNHTVIIEPYQDFNNFFMYSAISMCTLIINALKNLDDSYEYIVIKRLDLLCKSVYNLHTYGKMWLEYGEGEWKNDYLWVGTKEELLHFFLSTKKYIEINNPPRVKNGEPYIHRLWHEMAKKYIPYEPLNLQELDMSYELLTPVNEFRVNKPTQHK